MTSSLRITRLLPAIVLLGSLTGYAEAPADQRYSSPLLKDPALVRSYLFLEGRRGQVKQLAGDGDGTLFLANDTLYLSLIHI